MKTMPIGNIDEFKAGQMDKVKRRKEEEKKIKQGVYQMHVMVEGECMETLTEEQKKAESKKDNAGAREKGAETEQKNEKKTDVQSEVEKLLAMGSKHYKTFFGIEGMEGIR